MNRSARAAAIAMATALLLLLSSYLIQIHGSYSRCQGLLFSGLYKCYLAVKLVKKGKKTCCHCYYYFMCAFPLSLLPLSPMCLYMFTSLCVNLLCSSRRRVTNLLYKKNNKSTILSCGAYCNIYVEHTSFCPFSNLFFYK